jgi:hypothetical protein
MGGVSASPLSNALACWTSSSTNANAIEHQNFIFYNLNLFEKYFFRFRKKKPKTKIIRSTKKQRKKERKKENRLKN